MINQVSIQSRVIDSSTAEKRRKRESRDLPKKASHQGGKELSTATEEDAKKNFPKGEEEAAPRVDITV